MRCSCTNVATAGLGSAVYCSPTLNPKSYPPQMKIRTGNLKPQTANTPSPNLNPWLSCFFLQHQNLHLFLRAMAQGFAMGLRRQRKVSFCRCFQHFLKQNSPSLSAFSLGYRPQARSCGASSAWRMKKTSSLASPDAPVCSRLLQHDAASSFLV